MHRRSFAPRPDATERFEEIGFSWHAVGGEYFVEDAAAVLTPGEVERLETATRELIAMCFDTVEDVVRRGDHQGFAIPPGLWSRICRSWDEDEPTVLGRFDLAFDGDRVKLLEFNAQTPTSLLEAAVAQWHWLEDRLLAGALPPQADQLNRLHEALIEQFTHLRVDRGLEQLHFTCARGSEEDFGTVQYLRETAQQAGIDTRFLFVDELGVHPTSDRYVDRDHREIRALWTLYPHEWAAREPFGCTLATTRTTVLEPLWKMLLSNKAILVKLWERYEGHELLLPATLETGRLPGDVVRKPVLSREGANVTITGAHAATTGGDYGSEGFLEQAYEPLPEWRTANGDARYPVFGAWVIGQDPAGIGIREGRGRITDDRACFLPHVILPGGSA